MDMLDKNIDLIGAVTAAAFYISAIMVFLSRLRGKRHIEYWLGIFEISLSIPIIYLFIAALRAERPIIYFIQLGIMLLWLIVELFLDYILKIDFRKIRWMVICYVVLFFGAAGGMIGIASNAGRGWSIASIILFLIMAVLAFVQRKITGM